MSLQHGVGFRSLKLIWRGKTFQRLELPVLIYGYHDGSLATQVNDVMLVEGFGRLCGHDSIVESPVTSGLYIGRRAGCSSSRTSARTRQVARPARTT